MFVPDGNVQNNGENLVHSPHQSKSSSGHDCPAPPTRVSNPSRDGTGNEEKE